MCNTLSGRRIAASPIFACCIGRLSENPIIGIKEAPPDCGTQTIGPCPGERAGCGWKREGRRGSLVEDGDGQILGADFIGAPKGIRTPVFAVKERKLAILHDLNQLIALLWPEKAVGFQYT
jgi:hypothetical protein